MTHQPNRTIMDGCVYSDICFYIYIAGSMDSGEPF